MVKFAKRKEQIMGNRLHTDRVTMIDSLVQYCKEKGWNFYTPNLAGKIQSKVEELGYQKQTRDSYVTAVVEQLRREDQASHKND